MTASRAERPASPSNERTPLLPPKATTTADEEKPLPKDQLFLLCLARLVEPVAFFSIFPFVNEMIHEVSLAFSLRACPYETDVYTSSAYRKITVVSTLDLWSLYSRLFNF